MSYFKHHVFFCCNQRGEGETCCNNAGATAAQTYAKDRIGELRLKGAGKVRVNKAGCMDRCDNGPVLVVYPEAVWYSYVDNEDIEEIIQEHLVHGRPVRAVAHLMRLHAEHILIDGPVGKIELIVENPGAPRGIALIGHPHPLFGGGNTNKVVQTLARTFNHLDYVALRPNFRGIGLSEGKHDDGQGETDDLLAVLAEAKRRFGDLPVALAGFSFGAYVQTRVAEALRGAGHPAQRLVLVGTASGFVEGARRYQTKAVPGDTIVIHGSEDTTVPLANVIEWAKPLELPVIVVPGADHFFHRRLHVIREIVSRAWRH